MHPIRLRDALTAVLVLVLLYVAAYYMLLTPVHFAFFSGGGGGTVRIPWYRFGGQIAKVIFEPAYELDRRLRPRYWEWQETSGTGCMSVPSLP
jgi:hypothetical protein